MLWLVAVGLPVCYFIKCVDAQIVDVDVDFDKINSDEALVEYVSEILGRIRTFKVPVHPRIRLFYQLLKKGMSLYADRTADTVFVPLKYNKNIDTKKKDQIRLRKAEELKLKKKEERKKKKEEELKRKAEEEEAKKEEEKEKKEEEKEKKVDKKEEKKEEVKKEEIDNKNTT